MAPYNGLIVSGLVSTREYSPWEPLLSSLLALQSPLVNLQNAFVKPALLPLGFRAINSWPILSSSSQDIKVNLPLAWPKHYLPSANLLQEGPLDPPGQGWRQDCRRHWCLPRRVPPPGQINLQMWLQGEIWAKAIRPQLIPTKTLWNQYFGIKILVHKF